MLNIAIKLFQKIVVTDFTVINATTNVDTAVTSTNALL